jgi:hypothetical protein
MVPFKDAIMQEKSGLDKTSQINQTVSAPKPLDP